jgi:hypothetical protein
VSAEDWGGAAAVPEVNTARPQTRAKLRRFFLIAAMGIAFPFRGREIHSDAS